MTATIDTAAARPTGAKSRRAVITRLGASDVIALVTAERPTPSRGEVLLRVEAAGVAFADVLMRRGIYPGGPRPPFTPGYDLVGAVEEVGVGVSGVDLGGRYAALTGHGACAEFALVAADRLVPVPKSVDAADGVALVLNYVTAYQLLRRVAGLGPESRGARVLVYGAAGGVGTAVLELARAWGITVYGTASAAKHSLVARLGGIPIDYRHEDVAARVLADGGPVDAVLDPVAGRGLLASHRLVRRGGTLAVFGFGAALAGGKIDRAQQLATFALFGLLAVFPRGRRIVFYSVQDWQRRRPDLFREDLVALFAMLAAGEVHPVIAARLPLAETARAHDLLERSAVTGKLVIMPGLAD